MSEREDSTTEPDDVKEKEESAEDQVVFRREEAPVELPPDFPKSGLSIQAHKLWIGHIDKRITAEQFYGILQPFGEVRSLRFMFPTSGKNAKEPRGYAFVEFSTRKEAEKAKAVLHHKKALGQRLVVDWARPDCAMAKIQSSSQTWNASEVSMTLGHSTSTSAKIQALEAKLQQMQGRGHASDRPVIKARPPKTLSRHSLATTIGRPYHLKQHKTRPPF